MYKLKTWMLLNSLPIFLSYFQIVLCSNVTDVTRDGVIRLEEARNVSKIMERLLKDYDKYERPFNRVKPLEIGVRFLVMSINHVSEEDMEFQLTLDFIQRWTDPRLAFNKSSSLAMFLYGDIIDRIWLPDSHINNARKIDDDPATRTIILFGNGTVDYSYRIFVTALSKMNFHYYPMDHQTLNIKIFSYRHTTDRIQYKWNEGYNNYADVVGFMVEKNEMIQGSEFYYSGNYSYVLLSITVRRRLGYFIMQFYFPCILCAVVSWLPFWMDRYEIGDRVSLGITTLLTEVFLSQYINSAMPHVSYVKAADEFILASFIFIFLALMEHVIVYGVRQDVKQKPTLKSQGKMSPSQQAADDNLGRDLTISEEAIEVTEQESNKRINQIEIREEEEKGEQAGLFHGDRSLLVDKISRILFPLSYVVFVTIYCTVYGAHYMMNQEF